MSRKLAYAGFMFLLGTALTAGAQPFDTPFHATGDHGETVKILPTPAKAGEAPGHPVDAPASGFAVYKASYGAGNLVDHGGLEIAGAAFVPIFYDSSIPASVTSGIDQFVSFFGSGIPDYTIIQQYGSHAPIASTITPIPSIVDHKGVPATLSDTQIQSYLAGLFSGGLAANPNTIYGVYLPPGTTSTMGSSKSCTNYCGYHSHFTYSGIQIKYAVFPYLTCSGCSLSGKSVLDMLTIVTSHEIREAVTDPGDNGKNAWYDRRGYEADDKCAWHNLYTLSNGQWVQPEYSNAHGGCVVYP